MRRRIGATVLALALCLGLLPGGAWASGGEEMEPAPAGTEESTPAPQGEDTYEVTEDNYETILGQIKTDHAEGSTITLVLTGDLGLEALGRAPVNFGLEGYHIIYKNAEGGPYCLAAKSNYTQAAVGDITFDNVWLALNQSGTRGQGTVSVFYANGHTVEFTKNFKQPIANLYGGASNAAVASTHLIINGDLINSDNPGATGQNWRVYGGGLYTSGTYSKNLVTGDVEIYLGPHSRAPWVYGGGENCGVSGNVTITMEGDVSDPNHQIGNISGGGSVTKDGPENGRYSGTVGGNVNLNLYSGRFSGLASGGSYISTGGDQDNTPEDIQKLNDQNQKYDYLFFGTVAGDVNVVFGCNGAAEDSCYKSSQDNYNLAGSVYSVIQGNVNVTVNDGANLGMGLHGMGNNDIVEGSVNITMNGGTTNGIWGLGEAYYTSGGTHKIGRSDDPDNNYYYPKDALNIVINGGTIGSIAWFERVEKGYGSTEYSDPQIYGNVMLKVNGGTITQIYMGNPDEAAPIAVNPYKLPYVRGDKGIELHITGGTITGNPSIYAHSLSRVYMGQRIYFENDKPIYLYHIDSANANNNEDYSGGTADIIVNNTAPASIQFYQNKSGTEYPALVDCGSVDIQSGTLALAGESTIEGDFTISKDGTLTLNTTNTGDKVNANGVLNVKGAANIADDDGGWLQTVKAEVYNWSSGSYRITANDKETTPTVGEVYLRSNQTNETAQAESDANLLDLKNQDAVNQGLYVEYTQEDEATTDSYSYAWRIAEGDPPVVEKYSVLYAFKVDGIRGASLPNAVTGQLPVDSMEYAIGDIINVIWPEKTEIPGPKNASSSNMGVWTFVGYTAGDGEVPVPAAEPHQIEVTEETLSDGMGPDDSRYIAINGKWTWEQTYTVTYEYDDTAPTGVTPPKDENRYKGDAVVTAASVSPVEGYTFSGWTVQSPEGVTIDEDGTFTMPNDDVVLVGSWEKVEDEPAGEIKVTPADITIYMGGEDGHDGVVNDKGEIESSATTLPVPGFTVTLPNGLEDVSVTNLIFQEAGDSGKTWQFQSYDGESTTIFKLVPAEDQEAVRMQFTNAAGETVTSDEFDVGANVNQELTMALYKGDVGGIIVKLDDGTYYTVDSTGTAKLTVRGTTQDEQYAGVEADGTAPAEGQPGLTAPAGTTYTINGGAVQVANTNGIALLFDDIINSAGDDRENLLENKVNDTLGQAAGDRHIQLKYLDLVDRNNGNAWVAADQAVTVYWPLPEGVNAETVTVLHFKGLNREMESDDIADAIEECEPEIVTRAAVEGDHVVFQIGTAGFSPFALVWEEEQEEPTPEPTPGLRVTKEADEAAIDVGDTVTYTITVTNTGETDLTDITVTDTFTGAGELNFELPENGVTDNGDGTFTIANLNQGQEVKITVAYVAVEADIGTIMNKVEATLDDNKDDDTVTVTVTEADAPALSVDKELTTVNGESYSGGKVSAGDELTYTITVTNTGNVALSGITVTDTFTGTEELHFADDADVQKNPDGTYTIHIDGLDVGETEKITATYTVTADDKGQTIKNAVTATAGDDATGADDTETKVENDELTVTKTADKDTIDVGDTVTYTIEVTNTGDVPLSGITVTDTFDGAGELHFADDADVQENPEGIYTITIDSLGVGETVTITAFYTARRADEGKEITNAAVAEDENGTRDEDQEIVTVEDDDDDRPRPPRPDDDDDVDDVEEPDETPVDDGLNREDHYAYLAGYTDGTIRPEGNITRAEVATIFFRLMTDEYREDCWSQHSGFTDVSAASWYNNAVSTTAQAGWITGYEDGSFRPDAYITRAEFATIAARFLSEDYAGGHRFNDIQGHWAAEYIDRAAAAGWIGGYEDGSFRPNAYITRAEVATLVNRMLDRAPDVGHLLPDMVRWPDNLETAWYYADIQEATNSHDYTWAGTGAFEVWTELLPNRDWAALEEIWSQANDAPGGEVMD